MDEQSQSQVDMGAWTMARLGNAIDVLVDRNVNGQPMVIVDPSQAYGMDERGNIYRVGQNNVAQSLPAGRRVSPGFLLLLIIGAIVLAKES